MNGILCAQQLEMLGQKPLGEKSMCIISEEAF